MRVKIILLVLCLLAGLPAWTVHADAGKEADQDGCPLGIIEGPDPIGYADCMLRGSEDRQREDDRTRGQAGQSSAPAELPPEIHQDPRTGNPFMVWADGSTGQHDIAFSQWTGNGWEDPRYLASSTADERDPHAFITEDGEILVTWWKAGPDPEVVFTRRDPVTERWSANRSVTRDGRRPAVAVVDGRAIVAFERAAAAGQQIVVARETPVGSFEQKVVTLTRRPKQLDIELHGQAGQVWMEWKHSARALAYTQWADGAWSRVTLEPWTDRSWSGERETRQTIRGRVLAH